MRVLVLGNGLLGSYLSKKNGWDDISRESHGIDITRIESYEKYINEYDVIVNCIAHTNTYDTNIENHWEVNYKAVSLLVDLCNSRNKKIVHISTDHVYSGSDEDASENDVPVHCANWYGYTKLLADGYVILKSNSYLIIRCTHKKYPFPYKKAYINQIGNFDYVDIIGDMIIKLIENNATGVFNVGTNKKSMYDLAIKSNPIVEKTTELYNKTTPTDVSMSLSKIKKFLSVDN